MQAYRKRASTLVALAAIGAASATLATAGTASAGRSGPTLSVSRAHDVGHLQTATPIKHLVVIFDENVSFDHYFATYPVAANPTGEPQFTAAKSTPDVNGLTSALLNANTNASNPARLDRSDALTCDQDHGYTDEQLAVDAGAMDQVVAHTGKGATLAQCLAGLNEPVPGNASSNYAVMDYYDGNTVTAMWNYAQHFAMSDNSYGTTYGPSTPGALNVTAANTYGAICGPSSATINDSACSAPSSTTTFDPTTLTTVGAQTTAGAGTDYSDADPYYDVCSYLQDKNTPASTIQMGGPNIGTALDAKNLTWGWFQGGFDNGYVPGQGTTPPTTAQICAESHKNLGGATVSDYSPHHEPFEYYASTANPQHLPPTSVAMIGHQDQANHQYDIADFWAAANQGNMPAVSYLKAPAYQDGHAGYSDPLDEQAWLTGTINHLESLPSWRSTAVVISYDDSDGWYDHVASPVLTQSQSPIDALTGTGTCGTNTAAVPRTTAGTPEQGKCGLGPRLPFLVISPYAKKDYVSSSITDQSSVVNFIEFNWNTGALGNGAADTTAGSILPMFDFDAPSASKLFLDATTGEPVQQ